MFDRCARLRVVCVPTLPHRFCVVLVGGLLALIGAVPRAATQEPPNPFGTVQTVREDARAGRLELSDGRKISGQVYLTRGQMLRIYDGQLERLREVPLRVVSRIECQVEKEWDEREWRFRENANDAKVYTGRTYPARIYRHTITLQGGASITGPLSALVYVIPERVVDPGSESAGRASDGTPRVDDKPAAEAESPANPFGTPAAGARPAKPLKFLLHKRDKGEPGTQLEELVYVKRIVFDESAEGDDGGSRRGTRP